VEKFDTCRTPCITKLKGERRDSTSRNTIAAKVSWVSVTEFSSSKSSTSARLKQLYYSQVTSPFDNTW